ncbi:MAG: hypothetical protein ABIO48_00515 [Pedococcus sp.]
MSLDDDQTPTTPGRILLFVLACVLALVLPLVVMRQIFGTDESASPRPLVPTTSATVAPATAFASASSTGTIPNPGAVATGPASLAAAAETCRLANLRQQAPLSAAEVSLAQFDKHIDAMNLLVTGKISLSVATTFWDETRVRATQNAAAFRRADKELAGSGAACPTLEPEVANAAPYGQVVALKSCASAITARDAALGRARTAVSTWEHHIHDMEMLRMGHLTPAQATAAWQKNWKTGEKQLATYDTALAKAKKVPCSLD